MVTTLRRAALAMVLVAAAPSPDFAADARDLDRLIVENYAYLERLPDGALPQSAELDAKRAAVKDARSLLHYVEDRLATLADHHAIAGRSFGDSWAVVPSFSDLWVDLCTDTCEIEAVRPASAAATGGVAPGDRLVAVDGVPVADAIDEFWRRLGHSVTPERASYTARVLAAGRRDRPRRLTISRAGVTRDFTLPSLYGPSAQRQPLTVERQGRTTTIRIENALGDQSTVAAFDAVMADLPAGDRLILDLTDTPSGGNTTVARGIMGWFATRPTGYQVHRLAAEERETGIVRQWVEQVLPRPGKHWGRPCHGAGWTVDRQHG